MVLIFPECPVALVTPPTGPRLLLLSLHLCQAPTGLPAFAGPRALVSVSQILPSAPIPQKPSLAPHCS